jgi:glycine C-acetyltransferase
MALNLLSNHRSNFIGVSKKFTQKRRFISLTGTTKPSRDTKLIDVLQAQLKEIEDAGTYKKERIIISPQSSSIKVNQNNEQTEVLNFCSNNYLGLSDNKTLIEAAKSALDSHGLGLSSVRFICGTQDIHKQLEKTIAKFHEKHDAILYSSAFDANAGIFEALLGPEDAVLSDSLNHASIIDGIRLSKAQKFRYNHLDMNDLEKQLEAAKSARVKLIVTDGAFSMDGDIAPLNKICELAEEHEALVMTDECHGSGFLGKTGRGAGEYHGVLEQVDIINSTLGKALGGAIGGFTTARQEIIDILRQKSRPYLFSNSLPPAVIGASLKVFEMISKDTSLRDKLEQNTIYFRKRMKEAGFTIAGENHPICPIILGDARLATDFANDMLEKGIYVVGFSYPVVPKGQARIRVQISAVHTKEQINRCIDEFIEIGKKHGALKV